MDKEDKKKEFYGGLKVEELKKLLKNKGAKVSGRKAELVERLIYYDKNNNFGYEEIKKDDVIETPPALTYKDINSSSPCPTFTDQHFKVFLEKYQTFDVTAKRLYESGFIKYIRFSNAGAMYYVKACCKAELKKHMQYIVDVCLSMDAEVQGCSCECPVGQSTEAHCKHVLVVLLGIRDFVDNKKITLEETCTQKLQTFHQPEKKYTGSPVKAEKFLRKELPAVCDKPDQDFQVWYRDYFRNLIVARGINNNMSLKQIIEPANTYGVEWDHSFYTKISNVDRVLQSLHVQNVSEETVLQIELNTRQQSDSTAWQVERTVRLTASLFHSCCCKYQNPDGAKSLVDKIINPIPFSSKATEHGKIHEQSAVDQFQSRFDETVEIGECGLFVCLERPYLGATPDRLLFNNSLIEVKCPYTNRFKKIDEKTVPYLERDSSNYLRLKKSHPYFYQVQGQMYATGRNVCEFVVWTFVDMCVIPIKRNEAFITSMLKKLDYFYYNYLKPALIEKYLYKNYGATFFTENQMQKLGAIRFNPK